LKEDFKKCTCKTYSGTLVGPSGPGRGRTSENDGGGLDGIDVDVVGETDMVGTEVGGNEDGRTMVSKKESGTTVFVGIYSTYYYGSDPE
jgi:hypothetical protein